jgi:hypothetical protein
VVWIQRLEFSRQALYNLSHRVWVSCFLPRIALRLWLSCLCCLNSWDYKCDPLHLAETILQIWVWIFSKALKSNYDVLIWSRAMTVSPSSQSATQSRGCKASTLQCAVLLS